MAEHVQSMYRDLEARVAEKTSELEEKRERLQALYDLTALVAKATTLKELAGGFVQRVRRVARADGVALRWSDETNRRFLLLAAEGLPQSMEESEQCLLAGECRRAATGSPRGARHSHRADGAAHAAALRQRRVRDVRVHSGPRTSA